MLCLCMCTYVYMYIYVCVVVVVGRWGKGDRYKWHLAIISFVPMWSIDIRAVFRELKAFLF